MNKPITIQGEALALVSQWSNFDPRHPEKGQVPIDFTFVGMHHLVDGRLGHAWSENYALAGTATIVVSLHGYEQITANRIAQLQAERAKILAEAQAKATEIDRRIQSMLAIEHGGS